MPLVDPQPWRPGFPVLSDRAGVTSALEEALAALNSEHPESSLHKSSLHSVGVPIITEWPLVFDNPQRAAATIFRRLPSFSSEAYNFTFSWENMEILGSSPELVLSAQLMGDGSVRFSSIPTSGSMSHVETQELTPSEAERNLYSPQNRAIHKLTVEATADRLSAIADVIAPPSSEPWPIDCHTVLDLSTPILGSINGQLHPGSLASAQRRMLDLAWQLLASPATVGYPHESALAYHHRKSSPQRGYAGGIIGWVDLREDSSLGCELVRATRLACIHADGVTAYDSVPLLADSLLETALHRIEAKLSTLAEPMSSFS
ncbi:MAG: chorismate-binding protein [Corynebacterium sp.]|nr:chorismate-binding protein [Corynebacterium sp.]